MTQRRLAELRASELGDRVHASSTLVLPVGAIEQHGPHLPYATDLIVAEAAAATVVDAVGDEHDLWLLPALAYTKSNEHAWASGTFWLSAQTMLAVLDDLGRCAARTGARRLAFVNGHGGNSSLLNVACRDLRLRHGLQTFLVHPFVPPDQGGTSSPSELGMGIHAGHDETSMILHLRPDLVDMSLAERHVPERLATNRYVRFGGSVSFGWLSDDFGPAGVIGDPTGASAEHGAQLWETCMSTLRAAFAEIASFE
jgi:creatinine amidohydrolase